MLVLIVLCHVMSTSAHGQSLETHVLNVSCRESHDHVYGGKIFDCSGVGIESLPLPWLPDNTTTLILDGNRIKRLTNGSFSGDNSRALRHLSVRSCQVAGIEVDALFGLESLEVLNLEQNNLPICHNNERSFPVGMFAHVPNLRHLFLAFNTEELTDYSKCSDYSHNIDIFDSLPLLTNLSIDAVNDTLHLGHEFSNLTRLTNLTIGCSRVSYIYNTSLEGLGQLEVEVLSLVAFEQYNLAFELGVFENLFYLTSLTFADSHVGNHNILKALAPLAGRNMTTLNLTNTGYHETYSVPTLAVEDGIIGEELAASLRSICVTHFVWTYSFLYAFKSKSVTSGAWPKCLRTLDLSNNKLETLGWVSVILEAKLLYSLREVTVSSFNAPPSSQYPRLVHYKLPGDGGVDDSRDLKRRSNVASVKNIDRNDMKVLQENIFLNNRSTGEFHDNDRGTTDGHTINRGTRDAYTIDRGTRDGYTIDRGTTDSQTINIMIKPREVMPKAFQSRADDLRRQTRDANESASPHSRRVDLQRESQGASKSSFPLNGNISYYFLPSSKKVKIISLTFGPLSLGSWTIVCHNFGQLEELYWVNNNLVTVLGVINGVGNLRLMDLTGSMFNMASHFFDTFYGLQELFLSGMRPDDFFTANSIERLLRNLTNLRYFDASNNKLNSRLFPPTTFSSTPNITHVILSQNRFSNIPFDLSTTPRLEVLDMSENAILFLTEDEMEALNLHVGRVGHFLLRLQDNGIACVCSQIKLVVWSLTTQVTIQQASSYKCLSDNGQSLEVKNSSGIEAFCRICNGRFYLMSSLVLASLMVAGFLMAYLLGRFRTSILAFLLSVFVKVIRPMGPEDYKIGVFVGYADEDYLFVRRVIIPYLEGRLGLKTFIHQRDLGPGALDRQFLKAIRDSWRTMLVLSREFLKNYDMADIVMKYASHSVSAANKHRVFVLVERKLLHALPDYLHGWLEDTQIIFMDDLRRPLNYEQKQSIRRCLRP